MAATLCKAPSFTIRPPLAGLPRAISIPPATITAPRCCRLGSCWWSEDYGTGYLKSAELYDPVTHDWTPTGSLSGGRAQHTATLLLTGKVLIVGGVMTGTVTLDTAELYDPITGVFTPTGSLSYSRYDHTATMLPSGEVLVTGGVSSFGVTDNVEIYNPTLGSWSFLSDMYHGRRSHTATLLPNGKVLIAGGLGVGILKYAELYDPATGFSLTVDMNTAHAYHTATLLPSGKVLIAGGMDSAGGYETKAEIYDPGWDPDRAWKDVSWMGTGRVTASAALLPSGKVLVVGGDDGSDALRSAELFDSGLGFSDAWRPVLNGVSATVDPSQPFKVFGSGFRGFGRIDTSSGGIENSPTNYPLVQIHWLDNNQIEWLSTTRTRNSATTTSSPPHPAAYRSDRRWSPFL